MTGTKNTKRPSPVENVFSLYVGNWQWQNFRVAHRSSPQGISHWLTNIKLCAASINLNGMKKSDWSALYVGFPRYAQRIKLEDLKKSLHLKFRTVESLNSGPRDYGDPLLSCSLGPPQCHTITDTVAVLVLNECFRTAEDSFCVFCSFGSLLKENVSWSSGEVHSLCCCSRFRRASHMFAIVYLYLGNENAAIIILW